MLTAQDHSPLPTPPSQAQSSMTTDAYFDDIKSLKAGQMLNCEIIQSLAESVHDLASVISRVQGNEVKNNSNFSKNTEKSDVKQSEYANFANTKSSFVLEELTDSPMNNNNNNDRISPTAGFSCLLYVAMVYSEHISAKNVLQERLKLKLLEYKSLQKQYLYVGFGI